MKVVYVAGKFSSPSAWDRERYTHAACAVGVDLAKAGASPLIPHANTGRLVGTRDEKFWYDATLELMLRCDGVLCVPNWTNSQGAVREVQEALARGIPVAETLWHMHDETSVNVLDKGEVEGVPSRTRKLSLARWVDELPRLRRTATKSGGLL